jgi:RHS repeat-associated protein
MGETENSHLFTGEKLDISLSDYYLRGRYYDSDLGRFTRMDNYAGRLREPVTLHKYMYAYSNPSMNTDPSGRDVREGDIIHFVRKVGEDPFVDNNPFSSSRAYDPRIPSRGRQRPTMLRVFRREIGNNNHPGVRGVNRLVPDLVDFNDGELYEIKQNQEPDMTDARNNLTRQTDALHQLGLSRWHRGDDYTPPIVLPLTWIREDWG